METSQSPPLIMFAPLPLNTASMVNTLRWSVNDNKWLQTEGLLIEWNQCLSQFGMSPQIQKRLVSLSFQTPGSLCPIHPQTWQSCAPWTKLLVYQHLKVNSIPKWVFNGFVVDLFLYFLKHIIRFEVVTVHVKNANSVTAAEDVVLSCGLSVLPSSLDEVLSVAVTLSRPLLEHLHCVVVTLGANGLLVCGEHDAGSVNLQPRKQKRVRADCFRL